MYKNSIKNILYPLIVAAGVVCGLCVGRWSQPSFVPAQAMRHGGAQQATGKLEYLLGLIDRFYLEPVDLDSVTEAIIPMIMGQLDPHSVYIAADQFADVNERLDGEIFGIGVMFTMPDDTARVTNVISGGPSQKAGVASGDRIIEVDGRRVAGRGVSQDSMVTMLRGANGSQVTLSLRRAGAPSLVMVTVNRARVLLRSVTAAFIIEPGVGYIKLDAFSQHTFGEMTDALAALEGEGMRKLILDLRSNPGGFLDQPILIANELLPGRRLIVYTEDKYGHREESRSDGRGRYTDLELAVLVDESSASSSEVLAGALQDNDRGVVIGRRSFGKGLVQSQMPFSDGSAVRLTVSKYFTPTGRSIQRPYSNDDEEYYNDFARRLEHWEFYTADSIRFDDSLRFTTPGGRVVYGGGGIMPDIFVPVDTAMISGYYIGVAGRNLLYDYAMDYADRHRGRINAIADVAELDSMLDGDTTLLDDFVRYAAARGVKADRADIELSRPLLTAQLRALIGRNTPLEDSGYYSNIYTVDDMILRALDALGSGPAQ